MGPNSVYAVLQSGATKIYPNSSTNSETYTLLYQNSEPFTDRVYCPQTGQSYKPDDSGQITVVSEYDQIEFYGDSDESFTPFPDNYDRHTFEILPQDAIRYRGITYSGGWPTDITMRPVYYDFYGIFYPLATYNVVSSTTPGDEVFIKEGEHDNEWTVVAATNHAVYIARSAPYGTSTNNSAYKDSDMYYQCCRYYMEGVAFAYKVSGVLYQTVIEDTCCPVFVPSREQCAGEADGWEWMASATNRRSICGARECWTSTKSGNTAYYIDTSGNIGTDNASVYKSFLICIGIYD